MPSLMDRLKQNRSTVKQGAGPLTETSNEEVQSLAQQAGMPTTPSSPMGAESIGGNADQAKMMGTPTQNMAAIRLATREQDQLTTAQRQEQARTQATAQEQEEQLRALKFEGFGSLGDRVQQLATRMLNQTSAGENAIAQKRLANTQAISQYLAPGADQAETESLVNKLGDNTINDQEMVQLAQNLGYTDVSDLAALKTSVQNQFLTQEAQVGQFTAGRVADNVKMTDLKPEDLTSIGFDSIEDMAAALQVDPAALEGMTLKDLQNQFGKEQMEDYGKVAAAQQVLSDPSFSRAEKEQALKELKELGATGVRSAESDVKKINEQVRNADTIKFGGEEYRVEDLLKDDTITGLAKKFFTDEDAAKALKESEPAFAQWLDDNKKVMMAAAAQVDERQEEFADIQLENMKLKETPSGNLSEGAMKAILPDYGKLRAEKYAPPPFISMLKNKELPDDVAVNMVNTVNELSEIDPKYAQSFSGLSKDEIGALRLDTAEGITDYRRYVKKATELQAATDEDMFDRVYEGVPQQAVQDTIVDNRALQAFGLGGVWNEDYSLLDSDNDGVPDNGSQLRDTFLNQAGLGADGKALTVREMLDSGRNAAQYRSGGEAFGSIRSSIQAQIASSDLFQRYGDLWRGDNVATPEEMAALGNKMTSTGDVNEYYNLERLKNTASMSDASRNQLQTSLASMGDQTSEQVLKRTGGYDMPMFRDDLAKLTDPNLIRNNKTPGDFNFHDLDGTMSNMSNALTQMKSQMADPRYRGGEFQRAMGQKVQQMENALTSYAERKIAYVSHNKMSEKGITDQQFMRDMISMASSMAALPAYMQARVTGAIAGEIKARTGIDVPGASKIQDLQNLEGKLTEQITTKAHERAQKAVEDTVQKPLKSILKRF